MRILVAFASRHGATEGIAAAVGGTLRGRGHEVTVLAADRVTGIAGARAVVLGSALYAGSWLPQALDFVDRHGDGLASLPVWLFSSGPLGPVTGDAEEDPRELEDLSARLLPEGHAVFPGALDLDRLGFAERMIMKSVRAVPGDHRDWEAIRAWSDGIADALGGP